jgi:deazaflavin-dependent oxidoreductase (nitroreductase family)
MGLIESLLEPWRRTTLARTYKLTAGRRAVNRIVRTLNSMGVGSDCDCLLTVPGRKSGILRTTPVTLVQEGDCRWIVAPYGEVAWVQNARAVGRVTLSHGRRSETVSFTELGPVESAPVLRSYIKKVAVTRPFFYVKPESPLEAFAAEAPRHPVFLVGPTT